MIKILVDAASDITKEEAYEKNIDILPIEITLDSNVFIEGENITRNEFYEMMLNQKGFAKTSLVPPQKFFEYFKQQKDQNNEVIYIGLSSKLSGTFNSAFMAKEQVEYDSIYLVDSLSASYAIKILADIALKMIVEDKTAKEIHAYLEEMKKKVTIFACLDTLEFLKRGGRINSTAAFIGELVNLKPIITINPEGKIEVVSKALGRTRGIINILKLLKKKKISVQFPKYILYSYGDYNCDRFEEKLLENQYGMQGRLQIGPTIGAHIGPEAFGIVFVEE